jgi:PIN domain nuclease of toxin-antitoxin system
VKLLVDTHVLIWIILNPEKLSERIANLFLDRENEIFLSIDIAFDAYPIQRIW